MSTTISVRARFLRRLQQNNPFYILSAACMLAGCLAITNSLSWTSIPMNRLLILIGTLNVYEAALIGLAAFLIRRREHPRDGAMLLILEAFFLIDITFLNAEIATSHLSIGLMVNIVLFLLAVVKLAIVSLLLGQSPRDGRFAALIVQMAGLFAMPLIFRQMDHGDLSPKVFYATWWGIGMLVPLSQEIGRSPRAETMPWRRRIGLFYVAMPWLSLILHAGILHYVYNVSFFGANAAPLLLALAFILKRAQPTGFMPRKDLAVLQGLLPLAAILVSLNNPTQLCFNFNWHSTIFITPTRLALAAAYVTYVLCFLRFHALIFLAIGAAAVPAWMFGPTVDQMTNAFAKAWNVTVHLVDYLIPRTAMDWGVTAIAAAFAFLGIGATVSLTHRIHTAEPTKGNGGEEVR
jgi:hypothetical protein